MVASPCLGFMGMKLNKCLDAIFYVSFVRRGFIYHLLICMCIYLDGLMGECSLCRVGGCMVLGGDGHGILLLFLYLFFSQQQAELEVVYCIGGERDSRLRQCELSHEQKKGKKSRFLIGVLYSCALCLAFQDRLIIKAYSVKNSFERICCYT